MNSEEFKKYFDEGYLSPPKSYGLTMFNLVRNNSSEYYCFTEGSTDPTFYSNLNNQIFLVLYCLSIHLVLVL